MASLFPCPASERGEKGGKTDGEKNEEEKETGGRTKIKKKGSEKRAARAAKGREEGRALHHRACRPFRRGVWLRDIKMC